MMYEQLILIAQKYVGVSAQVFLDAILADTHLDKARISPQDLGAITESAVKKLNSYGLDPHAYSGPLRRDILSLQALK